MHTQMILEYVHHIIKGIAAMDHDRQVMLGSHVKLCIKRFHLLATVSGVPIEVQSYLADSHKAADIVQIMSDGIKFSGISFGDRGRMQAGHRTAQCRIGCDHIKQCRHSGRVYVWEQDCPHPCIDGTRDYRVTVFIKFGQVDMRMCVNQSHAMSHLAVQR